MNQPQFELGAPAEVITQQSRTNFLYSFLVLPPPKREAIETVYAFCRVVDDIVDDDRPTDNPRLELNRWRNEIATCFSDKTPGTQLGRQLQQVVSHFPIQQRYFLEMIDGMEMDLERRRYRTFTELERYCYHVAGVTGLMCIEIFGYKHESACTFALYLGNALQLVNIMRDLAEDAKRGRVYLPADELEQFGYSEENLLHGVYNRQFVELMKFQSARARSYFQKAEAILHTEDRKNMVSAQIMGKIYFKILQRIEAADYNVFTHRCAVGKAQKAFTALATLVKSKFE